MRLLDRVLEVLYVVFLVLAIIVTTMALILLIPSFLKAV